MPRHETAPKDPRESSYLRTNYYRRAFENPNIPRLFCEGDSWFSFPKHSNTIDFIEATGRFVMLRLESSGDEVLEILSGKQKEKLREYLADAVKKGIGPHAILFSGGGNDIVGANFRQFIRTVPDGSQPDTDPAATWIHQNRFRHKLVQIEMAYRELADLRDDCAPEAKILVHGYDHPIPRNKGTRYLGMQFGPWMYPTLNDFEVPTQHWSPIAARMIDRFNEMLVGLASDLEDFAYVKAIGAVGDEGWSDEIHPKYDGFKEVARRFMEALKNELASG